MHIAQRMQLQLMPSAPALEQIKAKLGVHIASHFSCSADLGGDFWGCKMLSEDELALYCCDFSGHGIAAAINTFRFHALLEHQVMDYGREPAYFLARLNQQMHSLLQPDQFATAFYGVLHLGLDTLFYVGAGAPSPVLLRKNGEIEWVDSSGLPVGVSAHHQYSLREIPFSKGDHFICYSDCLIEQPTMQGTLLDEKALEEMISRSAQTPEDLMQALLKPFMQPDGSLMAFPDDLTVNVYGRQI